MGKERQGRKRSKDHDDKRDSDSSSSDQSHSHHRRNKSRSRRSRGHKKRRSSKVRDALHSPRPLRESFVDGLASSVRNAERETVAAMPVSTSPSSALELMTVFKELLQNIRNDSPSVRFPVMNVVPEFDPSQRNQTIDMWISKVNECASIYNWTEIQTIHYSLPKLVGLAQKWYQGLPSLLFSWSEWQDKLKLAFPSSENYGQLLSEMLACRAKFGEPLEDYFYEKIVQLNRCHISGKEAIDCILFGIDDRNVRTSAEAAQFTEPDKLLVFLRNTKINKTPDKMITVEAGNSDSKRSIQDFVKPKLLTYSDGQVNPKCYNCREEGHTYLRCKQPLKKCDICHKIGHVSSECNNKTDTGSNNTV